MDGMKQLGIDAQQFCEHGGVATVAFALVFVDGSHAPGVGYGHVHPFGSQQPVDPGAVSSDFDGNARSGVGFGQFPKAVFVVGYFKLFLHFSGVAHKANCVFLISEVDADYGVRGLRRLRFLFHITEIVISLDAGGTASIPSHLIF
ncbi:MAG: hypothetical protein CMO55_20365 [Verrucomicrobiales bacterium]|nr:hypothetical protein [Verrucomicrobiales bacterium]